MLAGPLRKRRFEALRSSLRMTRHLLAERVKKLVRSGVLRRIPQLAWRFLMFQKESALAQWFRARTETARGTRKTMIVALARKL